MASAQILYNSSHLLPCGSIQLIIQTHSQHRVQAPPQWFNAGIRPLYLIAVITNKNVCVYSFVLRLGAMN